MALESGWAESSGSTPVGARGNRLYALDAATGRVRALADAKSRLPGPFRDNTNGNRNPPRVDTFTRDGKALMVIVTASSPADPGRDHQFGVRVPLDGSVATALPADGKIHALRSLFMLSAATVAGLLAAGSPAVAESKTFFVPDTE